MAIIKRLQGNSTEIQTSGITYPVTFPVDDNAVTTDNKRGIEALKLFAVKGDGTSEFFYDYNGGNGATAVLADVTNEELKAVGLVVDTSDKNMYSGLEYPDQVAKIFKPFGVDHENRTIPPLKRAILFVYDDVKGENKPVFNTDTIDLTGTVEIAGGAEDTVAGTGTDFVNELAVGDLIAVGGYVREVKTITDATTLVVSEAFPETVASGATARRITDFGRPVYLSTNGDFTKIKPVTIGAKRQEVGYVSGGNNITIDIKQPEIIK